ncbi:MAG: prepilin-type N-terminal cleavage/methylation domain-containing protein [Pseudomonadota bacterium]
MKKSVSGFTLIELMIVIAIIGILASIAVPQYQTYNFRSRFTEVVVATRPFKTAFEVAAQTGRITAPAQADSGALGMPSAVGASGEIASVSMTNGVITGTAAASIGNGAETIILTPSGVSAPIQWTMTGTCVDNGLC